MNRLKLHAFDQVKLKTLVYLVSSLNRLTHLDLSFTKASDTVVEAIGRNCRSIRVLKLHSCPVTDIGLRSLYSTSDGQPNETCANLEVLDVRETRTHAETVAALLQSLNNMQYLYHDELSEAIWISLTGASPAGLNKLRFFNMRVKFAEDVPSLLLDRIRTSCSNLCEYQQIGKLENGNLEFLNGLPIRALNMISGTNFNGEPMIDFAHDISTFLTRPNAIRVLEFLDVVGVDVGLLAKFCPCLEQLHLEYIYHLEECEIGDANGLLNEHSFDKLKELSLRFYSGRVVMSDDTLGRLFVASRNLTSLNLEEVDAFNDDVMKTVRETNSLKRVENLILIHCNVVSGGALLPLVHGDNELRHLDLMDCWNVTKADSIAMNEFIESKNFDLEVEWS
ncbi:uncharacterized protein LOC141913104 [Tubulanus polymorphus]|uniref:uncharacterized protein LOC141913104 n=1 Tax=Tubulanus polymorphus TaxID=672921 RepID=UPI003DA4E485